MMKKLLFILMSITLFAAAPHTAAAQSASKFYSEGVTLMRQGEYDKAIQKFDRSKRIDTSAANKSRCDSQIAKAHREQGEALIKRGKYQAAISQFNLSISFDGSAANKNACNERINLCKKHLPIPPHPDPNPPVPPQKPTLFVDATEVTVDGAGSTKKRVTVTRTPDNLQWAVTPAEDYQWVKCDANLESGELTFDCDKSPLTSQRKATFKITAKGAEDKVITLTQEAGKAVEIDIQPTNVIKARRKGGDFVITVKSTSTTIHEERNGYSRNWKIVAIPEWCREIEQGNTKSHMSFWEKLKYIFFKTSEKGLRDGLKDDFVKADKETLVINVQSNNMPKPRTGEILIESEGQQRHINVDQKK